MALMGSGRKYFIWGNFIKQYMGNEFFQIDVRATLDAFGMFFSIFQNGRGFVQSNSNAEHTIFLKDIKSFIDFCYVPVFVLYPKIRTLDTK